MQCKVEGCNGKHHAKGYCNKHYRQIKKFDKIIPDTNEIVIYSDYAEIILLNREYNEVGRALIDLEDVEKVKNYRWNLGSGYILSKRVGLLHRFILNAQKGEEIDHKSINPLDNRKQNLRKCTSSQNSMNRGMQSNNTSGVKGVHWDKKYLKWKVYIKVDKKLVHLGHYENFDDAVQVRKNAEVKYYGSFKYEEKG